MLIIFAFGNLLFSILHLPLRFSSVEDMEFGILLCVLNGSVWSICMLELINNVLVHPCVSFDIVYLLPFEWCLILLVDALEILLSVSWWLTGFIAFEYTVWWLICFGCSVLKMFSMMVLSRMVLIFFLNELCLLNLIIHPVLFIGEWKFIKP